MIMIRIKHIRMTDRLFLFIEACCESVDSLLDFLKNMWRRYFSSRKTKKVIRVKKN